VLRYLDRLDIAKTDFDMAYALYQQMCPHDSRKIAELNDGDFDIRVMFWSR
jgi:hypothetical protein